MSQNVEEDVFRLSNRKGTMDWHKAPISHVIFVGDKMMSCDYDGNIYL